MSAETDAVNEIPVLDDVNFDMPADQEVLVLMLKPSYKSRKGRELDPYCCSPSEREAFAKVVVKQWEKRLALGAVEIVYPPEAEKILSTRPQTVL